MQVLILHDDLPPDARTDELDVFDQVQAVGTALNELGHSWSAMSATLDLASLAQRFSRGERVDVVVNLVESLGRKMRLAPCVPALLDVLGVPYTGAGTEALFLTSGKLTTKRWLAAHGLPTPTCVVTDDHGSDSTYGPFQPGRYIIKSVWEHASFGLDDASVVEVEDADDLRQRIASRADQLGGEAFAEAYIDGREFNLSLLDSTSRDTPLRKKGWGVAQEKVEVLPPAEMTFVDYAPGKPRIVGYAAKWTEHSFEYHKTPRRFEFPPSDAPLIRRLQELAVRCWEVFALRGYARVDFRLDERGAPWVLEINANPCLSPDAGFMAAARQAGLSCCDVVARLLNAAQSGRAAHPSLSAGQAGDRKPRQVSDWDRGQADKD